MLGEWDAISFRITIFRALMAIYNYIQWPACRKLAKEYMKKLQQGRGQLDSILFCSLPRLGSWTKGSGTFSNQGGTPLACRGSSPWIPSIWDVVYRRDSRDWINRQKKEWVRRWPPSVYVWAVSGSTYVAKESYLWTVQHSFRYHKEELIWYPVISQRIRTLPYPISELSAGA